MPKTIIFSFDGTGNDPGDAKEYAEGESISNVLKLHILLGGGVHADLSDSTTKAGNQQITHYYSGVGTRKEGSSIPLIGGLINKAMQFTNQAIAPTWGDARRIIGDACEDFKKINYKKGDKIVIFGFSRGAALARKFTARILRENEGCRVAFLGVFDTVAAMNGIHRKGEKISSDVVFENGTLHENVERAVHLVSLDENRTPFTPTLINADSDHPDRILEVWFPGVHSDIGGSYWYDGLSDVTLQFMIDECDKALGEAINFVEGTDPVAIQELLDEQGEALDGIKVDDVSINENCRGIMHTHSGGLVKKEFLDPRQVYVAKYDRPCGDRPLIHWTVKKRFQEVAGYRPCGLRGLPCDLLLENGKKQAFKGIAELRE